MSIYAKKSSFDLCDVWDTRNYRSLAKYLHQCTLWFLGTFV